MRKPMIILLAALVPLMAVADTINSFSHAKSYWLKTKDRSDYLSYETEFKEFSDKYNLGDANECAHYGGGKLTLMIVLKHDEAKRFATVQKIFTDVHEWMAGCYKQVYGNLKIKPPPYDPFVLRVDVQGHPMY